MKKLASVAFAVALSAGSLNLARADQPGPDWMPAQQVIEQVLKSGYTQVTNLKLTMADGKAKVSKTGRRWTSMPIPRRV